MAKGGGYEREISQELSLWFSNGKHDDLFWRSSQSGGRATVRRRKGKTTRGHCGDITATDNLGQVLIKTVTFEIKRGYNKATFHDLLDKLDKAKEQTYESWIKQARKAARNAETPFWMIIHKRDRHCPFVLIPIEFYLSLRSNDCFPNARFFKSVTLSLTINGKDIKVFGTSFDTFFKEVNPNVIRNIYRIRRKSIKK